jgi:hypothetical protein
MIVIDGRTVAAQNIRINEDTLVSFPESSLRNIRPLQPVYGKRAPSGGAGLGAVSCPSLAMDGMAGMMFVDRDGGGVVVGG